MGCCTGRGTALRFGTSGRARLQTGPCNTPGSHNPGLRELIESDRYVLEVAGPYGSTAEAALVEAALISALSQGGTQAALVNEAAGTGPKFRPLGVPGDLAERKLMPTLTLAEIGEVAGGALLVRNSFGADLSDGRPRLDPLLQQQDDVIVDNLVKYWRLDRLIPAWASDPALRRTIGDRDDSSRNVSALPFDET